MTIYNGIDVSKHQGTIDWEKVKNDNVQFCMIRSSAGKSYVDPKLDINVKGCEDNGIDYGFYHYSYAMSVEEAEKEVEFFLDTIKKYNPTYPVAFDLEDNSQKKLGKKILTEMAVAFMNITEKANYYTMLYTNKNWLYNYLYRDELERFDKWIADWTGRKPDYIKYGMWQYSVLGSQSDVDRGWAVDVGSIDGIDTAIDVNYSYKNYSKIIKSNGLNKPDRLYKITAIKENLTEENAEILINELEKLDMTIITEEL